MSTRDNQNPDAGGGSINYVVYHKKTGEIIQNGVCPEDLLHAQATGWGADHAATEGSGNRLEHIVDVATGEIRHHSPAEKGRRKAHHDETMAGKPPETISVAKLVAALQAAGIKLDVNRLR